MKETTLFKNYKEAFLQVNGQKDTFDGREWTDEQIREDARYNGIELTD